MAYVYGLMFLATIFMKITGRLSGVVDGEAFAVLACVGCMFILVKMDDKK